MCGYKTDNRRAISEHMIYKHMTDPPQIKCQHCKYTTKTQREMYNHTFQAHSDCSEPLQCEICGKKFKTLEGVEKHRLFHQKVFECEPCKLMFTTKMRLYIHNRKFHSAEKDVKLECEICDIKFNNRTAYNMHKVRHRYTCPIKSCGQMFQSKHLLELHNAKVHLNDVTVS